MISVSRPSPPDRKIVYAATSYARVVAVRLQRMKGPLGATSGHALQRALGQGSRAVAQGDWLAIGPQRLRWPHVRHPNGSRGGAGPPPRRSSGPASRRSPPRGSTPSRSIPMAGSRPGRTAASWWSSFRRVACRRSSALRAASRCSAFHGRRAEPHRGRCRAEPAPVARRSRDRTREDRDQGRPQRRSGRA